MLRSRSRPNLMAKSATILSESFAVIFGNDKISINFVMELSFSGPQTIVWEKCYKNFFAPNQVKSSKMGPF